MSALATAAKDQNQPLNAYRKLKLKYGGDISGSILQTLTVELRDIVPRGRYTSRGGAKPVCVSSLSFEPEAKSIDDILVVFEEVGGTTGQQRLAIAYFLAAYRFFAPDCA